MPLHLTSLYCTLLNTPKFKLLKFMFSTVTDNIYLISELTSLWFTLLQGALLTITLIQHTARVHCNVTVVHDTALNPDFLAQFCGLITYIIRFPPVSGPTQSKLSLVVHIIYLFLVRYSQLTNTI